MKKNKLGSTNIYVSEIGFGVLTMGGSQLDLPIDEGAELIKYALSRGINFFDTAQYYETYPYMRKAFDESEQTPIICSKCLGHGYFEMRYAVKEALEELNRDYIDIFLMHEVRPDEDRSGAWEYLLEAKKEGLVKAIGISTHHIDIVEEYTNLDGIDVMFPLINYDGLGIRKGNSSGTSEEMAAAIKNASQKGIGVFAMKVFGGGHLTCTYQKALNYVKNLEGIDSMMIGFGKKSEIDNAIDYIEDKLDKNYQPDVSLKKTYIEPGNCEGCGACIARCPNKALYFNEEGFAEVNHDICLTCGYCAPVCPVRAIILL